MARMGDMDDMPGMGNNSTMPMPHKKMMMHMTFFWGKDVQILFSGWPGDSLGMYLLALFFVFALSVIMEVLSAAKFVKPSGSNRVLSSFLQTAVHAVRMGLAYMVMLAVMSFNIGVLIAAIVGHAAGFLVFRSSAFRKNATGNIENGLPDMK